MPCLSTGATVASCAVRNGSAETVVVKEGRSQVVGELGHLLSGSLKNNDEQTKALLSFRDCMVQNKRAHLLKFKYTIPQREIASLGHT